MLVTEVPYAIYFDRSGKPLDGGYVYFGLENQNPETNPVQVFWDQAGTQPVAQPVRTMAGYPTRAGVIAQIYSNTAYSVTVRDSSSSLVHYAASSQTFSLANAITAISTNLALPSGSSVVGFQQSGTGAVSQTVQQKLREKPVSVKDFGAVGDGIADDTQAFLNAISAAGPGRDVYVPRGVYKITMQLSLQKAQRLIGDGGYTAFKTGLYAQITTINTYVGKGATTTPTVMLDLGSGVSSICFNYPEQAAPTDAAPVQFSWAISTKTGLGYFTDDVSITDVMFVNAYMGINIDGAGRALIEDVAGDCIAEGLRFDNIYDVPRIRNVHIWTYTYTQGTSIGNWIQANGRGVNFNRVDDAKVYAVFVFGRNIGFDFNDAGAGAFWGDLQGCTADTCNVPWSINKMVRVSFAGGTLIPTLPSQPCLVTASDISEGQGDPSVTVVGTTFHTNGRIPFVVSSSTGVFTFTGCCFELAASGLSTDVVGLNTSTAKVNVLGSSTRFGTASRLTVLGDGQTTTMNGVPNPACITDVTPSNLNMATFTAGIPNNWTMGPGGASNIANQGSGFVRLLLNSGTSSVLSYNLPANILQRRSLYTLRVLIRYFGTTDAILTFYARRADTTNTEALRRFRGACHGNAIPYYIPLYWGYDSGAETLDIEWSTPSGAGTGYIEIAGLQLFECDDAHMQQDVIDQFMRREFLDPYGLGPTISKVGSNRRVEIAIGPPTAGTWRIGDEVVRNPPVVGQPQRWRRVTAGSGNVAGTDWISEGNL